MKKETDKQNLNELQRSIGRLEGKMDMLVSGMQEMASSFSSLEKGRLSKLEIAFANLIGKLTIIAVVVSALMSVGIGVAQHYLGL